MIPFSEWIIFVHRAFFFYPSALYQPALAAGGRYGSNGGRGCFWDAHNVEFKAIRIFLL